MTSKRDMLANLLFTNNLFEKLQLLTPSKNLSILAYHRVVPLPDDAFPYVKGVISCDEATFDRQLDFIKKYFNVINFHQLHEILQANEDIPPNSLILTFDDGYADNYTNMLPILEHHGMTAVVFLATHYIDTGDLFWVDELAYTVMRMPEQRLEFLDGEHVFDITGSTREASRRAIGRLCASVSFADHMRIMRELRAQVDITPSADEYELARPLTWHEVTELDRAGVEIGGHTVTHGFLDRMTRQEIEFELGASKTAIERHLEKKVLTVCYPAGKYSDEVLEIARNCDYTYGCSYLHGSAEYRADLQFTIPRIHVDYDVRDPLFKANLVLPKVFLR